MLNCFKLCQSHVVIKDGFLEKYGVDNVAKALRNLSCAGATIFGFYDDVEFVIYASQNNYFQGA